MYFKVLIENNCTIIEVNADVFTLEELAELINCALLQETRARNIALRRKIFLEEGKETAVHACLSHLDNLR